MADEEIPDEADETDDHRHLDECAEPREILANLVHAAAFAGFQRGASLTIRLWRVNPRTVPVVLTRHAVNLMKYFVNSL